MAKKNNKTTDKIKIRSEINLLRKSLLNLFFQKSSGQLEKISEIKKTKKKIASLLTSLNQNKDIKNA